MLTASSFYMMNQISIPNHPETETGIFLLEIDKHVSTFKINSLWGSETSESNFQGKLLNKSTFH